MPRAHTRQEREAIRDRLLAAGRDLFVRLGLHKTTVADLARDAGIGKGSFYHFFDSKEALFLAIQDVEEAGFKAEVVAEIEAASTGRAAVIALLRCVTSRLDRHPFLRALLDPSVIHALTLRVPPEQLEAHRAQDRAFFVELAGEWKRRGWLRDSVSPEVVFDVLSAMFAISIQRELLGRDVVERALHEMAEAVADRWCLV